jgi:hypothetical protein
MTVRGAPERTAAPPLKPLNDIRVAPDGDAGYQLSGLGRRPIEWRDGTECSSPLRLRFRNGEPRHLKYGLDLPQELRDTWQARWRVLELVVSDGSCPRDAAPMKWSSVKYAAVQQSRATPGRVAMSGLLQQS